MKIKRNILLNPGPATTSITVKSALVVPDICPREKEFGDLTLKIRERLTRVVNASETHTAVMFGGSGTAAVEACLSSVIGNQDRVLIIDNGAYGARAAKIAKIYGIPHEVAKYSWQELPTAESVATHLEAKGRFTHLFFIHHETTTGILNPLPELAALAQSNNLITIVDAMSSYAGISIDLQKTPVDFLISSANKCIQGMAGLSFVIANLDRLKASASIPPRNLYLNLYENHVYLEKNGQFQFTPPVQILYALDKALEEYFAEGQAVRSQRYFDAYKVMYRGMLELGFTPLLPESYGSKLLTTFYDPADPAYDFEEMHDYLYERGITIYPGKVASLDTFRIANFGEIDAADLEFYLETLQDYLRIKGIKRTSP